MLVHNPTKHEFILPNIIDMSRDHTKGEFIFYKWEEWGFCLCPLEREGVPQQRSVVMGPA